MTADSSKSTTKKGRSSIGCIVAPLAIIAMIGLFYLGHQLNRSIVHGTASIEGGDGKTWSMDLSACNTRSDILPIRADGGVDAYRSRVLNDDLQSEKGIQILRNTFSNLLSDDEIQILRGPQENPTERDRKATSRFMKERWHIQVVTEDFPPVDITPQMCSHFLLDTQLSGSNKGFRDPDGRLELDCDLPDGRKLRVRVEYDRCS